MQKAPSPKLAQTIHSHGEFVGMLCLQNLAMYCCDGHEDTFFHILCIWFMCRV